MSPAARQLLPALLLCLPVLATAAVQVSSVPAQAWIEDLPDRQDLNFDLLLRNDGATALELAAVEMEAFDAGGHLLLRRRLDGNGVRPSVMTVPDRNLAAGQSLTVFNPFPSLARDLPLARLHYRLRFESPDGKQVQTAELDLRPRRREQHARLRLPLRGRVINDDGHDAQAHHRRFDTSFAPIAQLGFRGNFMRYAYDFVPVDAQGRMFHGGGADNHDYPGFGAELLAAGDGRIAALEGGRPDDRHFDESELPRNRMALFGNYLVIDHGRGEYSLYAHLQQGSVRVKVGDRVQRGDVVARLGASGSAMFPHLHYELQDGPDALAEGLPSAFEGLRAWRGDHAVARARGTVDTGEIVESD